MAAAGCGSAPVSPPASPDPSAPSAQAPPAPASSPEAGASPSADATYDVVKGKDPIHLQPLFDKTSTPAFPTATESEQDCWRTIAVVGSARPDYEKLLSKCGAATGAVQYVRPTIGHLHHKHQRRDVFVVPIQGGLCYRFFGVGDATIQDLDVLIEQRGALVGDDKASGPVAIIESDKAWCIDHDGVYSFLVQTHGEGHGQYVFGIWARKTSR
jgi:hypothetical protein